MSSGTGGSYGGSAASRSLSPARAAGMSAKESWAKIGAQGASSGS